MQIGFANERMVSISKRSCKWGLLMREGVYEHAYQILINKIQL